MRRLFSLSLPFAMGCEGLLSHSYILSWYGGKGVWQMAILQDRLPVAPWMADHTLRLPGTGPIAPADWLQRDEVFAAQMAYRDRLIAERPEAVHAMTDACRPAAEELLDLVLTHLDGVPGYRREDRTAIRPDGVAVPLDGPPLIAAGRLVQEDLCVLEQPEGAAEHVLTGAILCFPSNWTLARRSATGSRGSTCRSSATTRAWRGGCSGSSTCSGPRRR